MDWLTAVPTILISLVLLIVPGLAVSLALRLRIFDAVAVAPLITVTMISVSAIAAPLVGISWSVLPLLVLTMLVAAACFLIMRFRRPGGRRSAVPRGASLPRQLPWFGAAAIAFLLIGWQVVHVIGAPENFSQTFDNVFHLNAVRFVLDTGSASSLSLTAMTTAGQPTYFYPAAWHGLIALIVQVSGAPITVATTAGVIAVSAAVWPLSVLFAARRLAQLAPATILGAGVLIGSFSAFPILLLDFGVLYPNLLSLAMVPAALMVVAIVLRQAPIPGMGVLQAILLAMLTLPGVAIAHPNGLMTLLILGVPAVVSAYIRGMSALRTAGARWPAFALATSAAAASAIIFLAMWKVIRPPEAAAFWDRVEMPAQAFGEAILNAPFGRPVALAISLLVLLGLIRCFRTPNLLWVAGAYFLSVWLFVVAAGYPISDSRMFVTGVWYNDSYRLAAVLPLMGAPLAILGLQLILAPVDRILRSRISMRNGIPAPLQATAPIALGLVSVLILLPLTQRASIETAIESGRANYAVTPDSALVSTDELELLNELDQLTPEDAVIAVNPWTGAALAYALSDRETTYKHTLSNTSPDGGIVDESLKDADSMPEVCDAVENTGVSYVLDFGTREVHGGDHRYPGIEEIEGDSDFEKVASVGEASLYRFIGCP